MTGSDTAKTILLVEDEALIAMAEAKTLKNYGYQVIAVFNGEQAVKAAGSTPEIDLVLMDIDLGKNKMDGTQAALLILQQRGDLPVIFLSNHTEQEIVEKTEGISSYGYIDKNSGEAILIASIKMAFRLFEARRKERANEIALQQIEANLRGNIARLGLALESAQAGTWEWDIPTGQNIWSDELWKVYGVEPYSCQPSFEAWRQIVHPADRELVTQIALQRAARGAEMDFEFRIQDADGSVRTLWSRGQPVPGENGQAEQYFGVAFDITRRKQVEEMLRLERDLNQSYLDTTQTIMIALDPEGRITMINRAGCALLGYAEAELLGCQWFETCLPQPDGMEKVYPIFRGVMDGDLSDFELFENHVLCRDGSKRLISWHNTFLRDDAGQVVGSLSSGDDITERKQAEEALAEAYREKQMMLRELQHRVKNSFSIFASIISLMQKNSQSSEVGASLSDVNNRLLAMGALYELLYASDSFNHTALDLYATKVTQSLPLPHNIRIVQAYDPVIIPAKVATSIGLILTELLTNAIKHAFPGGRSGTISISLQTAAERALLQVEDDGVGMPADFDLPPGSSLGLILVQTLAEQIHGSFRIERVGGTRCVVDFPVADSALEQSV